MQPPTVREVMQRLEKDGFEHVHTVGSHRKYVKGGRRVIVSGKHGEHLSPGTWASIQRQAGWK